MQVGSYQIVSLLGAGGMGEVYRALDTKLGRAVALKILPEGFVRDAERMARFQREARLLASLNHQNIASIYGLEDSGASPALVMELVEGSTLADHIRSGPIPIEEALRIARQVTEALEYAHEHGIIHRDLKPANVKVTSDDTVKILDFGLAKAVVGEVSVATIENSPTMSLASTEAGILLGTAPYMSPEQARGKPVDRRMDNWAFGCLLYEMLTGKMAFPGETVTDTLAAVMRAEPDWSRLPVPTPARVRVLMRRCLQKDPKQRLRDIGDARISLDEVLAGEPEPESAIRENPTAPAELVRFKILLPEKAALSPNGSFALSPNGRMLAFAANGSDGVSRLWIRAMDSLEAHPLPASEVSSGSPPPFFWSPDSRYIAFDAGGKLKKIDISGGPARTLCDLPGQAVGGSWNQDGVIIFGQWPGVINMVSANGGTATQITALDPSRGELFHDFPSFLPDGRHFIYLRRSSAPGNSGIYVSSLDDKPEEQPRQILATDFAAVYVPYPEVENGQLLFLRDGTLMAQSFDVRRQELSGEPIIVVERIGVFRAYGFFSVSTNGVLAYRTGGGSQQLTWFDPQGRIINTIGESGAYLALSLSPDGKRAAVSRVEGLAIWLLDLLRGTSRRFTFGSSFAQAPVWSPDGAEIIFASGRTGAYDLYQKVASGVKGEELLLKSSESKWPTCWSRDGRFLLYMMRDLKTTKYGLWVLPLEGDRRPFPFLLTEFNNRHGQFSPDGRFVAYTSDESDRSEIYVQTFSPEASEAGAGAGGKWLISTGGGTQPRWRSDGKELYYIASDGMLTSVEIETEPVFQAGVPKALFQTRGGPALATVQSWDLAPDAKSFFFPAFAELEGAAPFTVLLNWQTLLGK